MAIIHVCDECHDPRLGDTISYELGERRFMLERTRCEKCGEPATHMIGTVDDYCPLCGRCGAVDKPVEPVV